MKKVTLHIKNLYDNKTVSLDDEEISVGRGDSASLILDDTGLSRKNTTFFRDGEQVFVVDENSTNGTFVNGEKISGAPVSLFDGDEITLGNETRIRVEIAESQEPKVETPAAVGGLNPKTGSRKPKTKGKTPKSAIQNPKSEKPPMILMVAIGSIVVIISLGLVALLIANSFEDGNKNAKPTPPVIRSAIPVRVVDPLGGEDPDDLDDIIAGWEIPEEELKVENVRDVKVSVENATKDETDLNVTAAFLAEQKSKAMAARTLPTGISPPGLIVAPELRGDGVIKQKAKLSQMISKVPPYQQPMDFSDLAQKRLSGELLEMPMATKSFYLEVGGSASEGAFTAFSFQTKNTPITQGSPKYEPLSKIAAKYSVNLDNAPDRKQIRMRLLRMFNPKAKPILQELAEAYYQKFNRPLRVTSLTRSIDYQILLNATNDNSFIVRGAGSLPPHTSGCAFDLARKHMGVDEQNFVIQKLAEMERDRKLDALIEYGVNACFHVFIYYDGIAPNM